MQRLAIWLFVALLLGEASLSHAADVAVRAAASGSGSSTAVSSAKPTGTVDGDLVICVLHINIYTNTVTDNNSGYDFTKDYEKTETVSSSLLQVWSHRASSDPSTYDWTLGTSARWSIGCIAFSDPHASTVYDVSPSDTNYSNVTTSGSTVASIGFNTATDKAIVVEVMGQDVVQSTGSVLTAPSGYTGQVAIVGAGSGQWLGVATKTLATAGAAGTNTWGINDWGNATHLLGFAIINNAGAAAPDTTKFRLRIQQ